MLVVLQVEITSGNYRAFLTFLTSAASIQVGLLIESGD